jgi:Acetyltransferase (GNAT) domain
MEEFSFRKLNKENIKDLIPVYKKAFGKDISEGYLIKKNSTEAYGLSFCGFIAYNVRTNEAAAFYGVYPCFVNYNGRIILAAQSGDTMTHPAYQGKGLFIKLALMTYDYVKNNGVKFVFGFPNENSYYGFVKKLNWQHFEDMHAYLIRVRCITWLRINKIFYFPESVFYWFANIIISLCKKGKAPFDNSVIDDRYAGIHRDQSFFNYKTYEKSYIINVCGKSVWLKPNISSLLVGDMERCTDKEFSRIIRRLKILSFILGVPYIRFHCSPGVYFEKMFEKISIKHKSTYPVGLVDFNSGLELKNLKFTMCDNDTF